MRKITRADIAEADFQDPETTGEGDLFRSDKGIEILLIEEDGFPLVEVRDEGGAPICVLEEGVPMEDDALSVLLWERIETFDAVIDRLAGPMPEV